MAHTARSVAVTPLTTYRASMRQHAPNGLINRIRELATHCKNMVEGCEVINPTTPSTQAAEPGAVVTWNVDIQPGIVIVNGVPLHREKAADYAVSGGVKLADIGKSVVATIFAKNSGGTVTIEKILGAAALTGAQVAPTDAEITAACIAGDVWIRLADITYNHTGDGTLTQSQDNTVRPNLNVNVGTGMDITV